VNTDGRDKNRLGAHPGWSRRAALGGLVALAATPSLAAATRLPLNRWAGKLFVPVVVNGVGAEALLDTGSARTSIDRAFAAQAGIRGHGFFVGTFIQGRVRGAYAEAMTLHVGDASVSATGAVILDYGQLSRELGRPVQVVLGRELFESCVVDLDVERGEAMVRPRAGLEPGAGATMVPLRPSHDRMAAPVTVEDVGPLWASVDLGADTPLILSPSAAARRLLQNRPTSTALIGGEGSRAMAQVATAKSLAFAGARLANVPFQVAPRSLSYDAILGLPVLQRFALSLDFGGRRMWLTPGPNLTFPFAKDRTGLNGYLDGGALRILHVARGGPAERAGFKAGEVVTGIDGMPAAAANAALVNAPAGRTLEFTLADGSRRRLTLADYY